LKIVSSLRVYKFGKIVFLRVVILTIFWENLTKFSLCRVPKARPPPLSSLSVYCLINIVTSFDRYILASMASTSQEHHLTAIKLTVSLYGRTWITVFSFGQTRVWFCPTTNLSITKLEFLVECSVHLHYHIEAKTTLLPSVTPLLISIHL